LSLIHISSRFFASHANAIFIRFSTTVAKMTHSWKIDENSS
jgi:hypothetical protein